MITYCKEPFTEEQSLGGINPRVRRWFTARYKELTPPQHYSFKLISEKNNILITAPTGSGKTFSAFLSVLSDLMDYAEKGTLEDRVYCVYVSPLKALNNDIYRNLTAPLEEMYSGLSEKESVPGDGSEIKRIRVGVRTGDTPQKDRQRMLAHPPHILITTPESLAIILNSQRFMQNMNRLEFVVVDELHEFANNKRGVHLMLSLERLANAVGRDPARIGLGATLHPLDEAARFLVGYKNGREERDCIIVDATWDKKLDFKEISPVKDIVNASDKAIDQKVYDIMNKIIKSNRTTLIFTNTRSGTERTVFGLMRRFGYTEDQIAAHHSSLSRETRLGVEETLKKGGLRCVVCSTSLELGLDIGQIDDVVQLGSPKSVTRAIQRIGRSGHSFKDTAKGQIIATNRDDLVECAVMLDSAKKRHLDSFTTPRNALDVLSQHIVGMALNRRWGVEEAYAMIRSAYPYRNLDRDDYMRLLEYLSGEYVGLESKKVYGKILYDRSDNSFRGRGMMTKLIYYLNLGTIADEVAVDVYLTEHRRRIGSIEEEFLARMKKGDIFVLGGKVYRFEESRGMSCFVSRAAGLAPTIPPWFSETLPLTYELAVQIGRFRGEFSEALKSSAVPARSLAMLAKSNIKIKGRAKEILDSMPMDSNAKYSVASYFLEQMMFAGAVPTDRNLLIEMTKDDSDRDIIAFHALFGRRINDALSRVIAIIIGDAYGCDVGIAVNDNGFVIAPDKGVKIGEKDLKKLIAIALKWDIDDLLRRNIRRTEMMKRRFRHNAARSFLVLRNYKGRKISVRKQQFNSEQVLKAAEQISQNFPIIKETYREILEDVMDVPKAKAVLKQIRDGDMRTTVISTPVPSPFSHTMITFGHSDVVLAKDRRERIRRLHKQVHAQMKKRFA